MHRSLEYLNIYDKQSLVDLLMAVQAGNVSCRRAATEITEQVERIKKYVPMCK